MSLFSRCWFEHPCHLTTRPPPRRIPASSIERTMSPSEFELLLKIRWMKTVKPETKTALSVNLSGYIHRKCLWPFTSQPICSCAFADFDTFACLSPAFGIVTLPYCVLTPWRRLVETVNGLFFNVAGGQALDSLCNPLVRWRTHVVNADNSTTSHKHLILTLIVCCLNFCHQYP